MSGQRGLAEAGPKRPPRGRAARILITLVLAAALAVGYLVAQTSGGGARSPRTAATSGSGPHATGTRVRELSAAAVAHAPRCTVTAALVPTCGAWWGMFIPAASDAALVRAVSAEQAALGRRLDIIERYHDMSLSPDGIFPDEAERQLARNHLLLFSWAPRIWSSHTKLQWADIASGVYDNSVIIPEARRLRAFGHRVFLTFASEPDGVWGQGSAAQFVAAWRHIHDVFARLGVRNVVWVWTTEGYLPHARQIAAMYPGNSYVDWIGYDPYNFYRCHHARWLSFPQVVIPFYRWLGRRGLGSKPVMLAEFSTAPDPADPGREAAWYRAVVPTLRQLPRIRAAIQWNSPTLGCDLRVTPGSAAGRAYRQAGLSPYVHQETR